MQRTQARNDFKGIPLTANYYHDYWPFNWVDEKGNVKGLLKEALAVASKQLNLTLIIKDPLEENRGKFLVKYAFIRDQSKFKMKKKKSFHLLHFYSNSDGTYQGLLGEVYHGIADTSIGGIGASMERYEIVDFSPGFFKTYGNVWIKRPLKTDVSLRYFWLGNSSAERA